MKRVKGTYNGSAVVLQEKLDLAPDTEVEVLIPEAREVPARVARRPGGHGTGGVAFGGGSGGVGAPGARVWAVRVLLDTNAVVSALLFGGTPRELLRMLCSPPFELWTSRPLLPRVGCNSVLRPTASVGGANAARSRGPRAGLRAPNFRHPGGGPSSRRLSPRPIGCCGGLHS